MFRDLDGGTARARSRYPDACAKPTRVQGRNPYMVPCFQICTGLATESSILQSETDPMI